MVSVDVKQYRTMFTHWSLLVPKMSTDIRGHQTTPEGRAQELCERGPEAAVLGSQSLTVLTVSVGVKEHKKKAKPAHSLFFLCEEASNVKQVSKLSKAKQVSKQSKAS